MSNSIINCIIDIFVKPDSVEKVRAILLKLVEYSLKEDGCLYYKLFENLNDKSQFTFIEIWINDEAFEDHLQADHIRHAGFSIYDDLTKETDVKRYKSIQPDLNDMKNKKTSRFCVLI